MREGSRLVLAQELTEAAFAPFGDVLFTPMEGRKDFIRALSTTRPHAWPSIGLITKEPSPERPYVATYMERHPYSSQTFVPTGPGGWLVFVAPDAADGSPDLSGALAFHCRADQGVTFAANTWHHGLTVLDRKQSFVVSMWIDGTAGDGEVFHLENAASIQI